MFLSILQEASPNALHEIYSPLPRLIGYLIPAVGYGYTTSMSDSNCLFLVYMKLAISCKE